MTSARDPIETAAQAARLHDLGYRYAQGYHFARPVHPAALADLLAAGVPVPAAAGGGPAAAGGGPAADATVGAAA